MIYANGETNVVVTDAQGNIKGERKQPNALQDAWRDRCAKAHLTTWNDEDGTTSGDNLMHASSRGPGLFSSKNYDNTSVQLPAIATNHVCEHLTPTSPTTATSFGTGFSAPSGSNTGTWIMMYVISDADHEVLCITPQAFTKTGSSGDYDLAITGYFEKAHDATVTWESAVLAKNYWFKHDDDHSHYQNQNVNIALSTFSSPIDVGVNDRLTITWTINLLVG